MSESRQILLGGAVAAALILAGSAHAADDHTWITKPAQSFSTHKLDLERVIGETTIAVSNGGPMTIEVAGPRYLVDGMNASANGDTLVVQGARYSEHNFSVWDWTKWFDYSDVGEKDRVRVTISVPRGSDVTINKQIGDVTLGDLDGHLAVTAVDSDLKVGSVSDANIKVVGGGDTSITQVTGHLALDIAGAGDVKIGDLGSASIQVAGSGDTSLGNVHGNLTASIAGSGDLLIASVNGPLSLSIAGSGDVKIAGGNADPFHVSIVGGGDVVFGGHAVDPTISAIGSGDVYLKSYSGNMSSSGMADVHVGDRDFPRFHVPPAPPAPPAPAPSMPASPPAPPAPPHHHG